MQSLLLLLATLLALFPAHAEVSDLEVLRAEVETAERLFAGTMASRDPQGFASFVSEQAVFFDGDKATRGRAQVVAQWMPLLTGPTAPFSWEPTHVEVLDSHDLALSTGPVRSSDGRVVGTFSSIWRREAPGVWRVIFDKGCQACDCAAKKP